MKNILNIIRYDLKKITGSVVAIITIMGLCLVPCSYAWFNILSNWAPYESEATGRILVAVANEDAGAKMTGLKVNVGDRITEALKANDDIGWVFEDSGRDAVEGVRAGKYYAALVIPEDFSEDAMSFARGELVNPRLKYYENEKKNAIAPKITGKAQKALKEEVNASFVETLTEYVSDAASVAEATGTDPSSLLSDVSARIEALSMNLESCVVLADSASGLASSAGDLLAVSGTLMGSTQEVIESNDKVLAEAEKQLSDPGTNNQKFIDEALGDLKDTRSSLRDMKKAVQAIGSTGPAFRLFVKKDRDKWVKKADKMQNDAYVRAEAAEAEGFMALGSEFTALGDKFGDISADLKALNKDMTADERSEAVSKLLIDIGEAADIADVIEGQLKDDIDNGLETALSNTRTAISGFRKHMSSAGNDLGRLSDTIDSYNDSLADLKSKIEGTSGNLKSLQEGADTVSDILADTAGNKLLRAFSDLLGNDEAAVARYLADPVRMNKEVLWPVENYGSAMAPFYTVLAQWVGALLTAVLIKVRVKKRESLPDIRLYQGFFGRFGLYFMIGTAQALVVSLGDLLYVRIQCLHPLLFVLSAWVVSLVFMMINYALVFALDNIGMGLGVIILVLQVAGSGGTYPVQVLPPVFKALYPFMPFRYAMGAMRECIAGTYGDVYLKCLGILMIFFFVSILFGLALHRPARLLNDLIAESKAKSEIML